MTFRRRIFPTRRGKNLSLKKHKSNETQKHPSQDEKMMYKPNQRRQSSIRERKTMTTPANLPRHAALNSP